LIPGFIALLVILAGALWLSQPPALTQGQVAALVHRALEDMPPKLTATEAFEKIPAFRGRSACDARRR